MSNFELNKIIASILLVILICMIAGNFADIFYAKNMPAMIRGFTVAVNQSTQTDQAETVAQVPELDIKSLMAKASAEIGKDVAKKCISCHNLGQGEPNKIGPHLWDVVGRDKASIKDYNYSKAMQNKGGKWDYESLFAFLNKPSAYIPGTKMSFAGINKNEDIANIIAFLRLQSNNPLPLP